MLTCVSLLLHHFTMCPTREKGNLTAKVASSCCTILDFSSKMRTEALKFRPLPEVWQLPITPNFFHHSYWAINTANTITDCYSTTFFILRKGGKCLTAWKTPKHPTKTSL